MSRRSRSPLFNTLKERHIDVRNELQSESTQCRTVCAAYIKALAGVYSARLQRNDSNRKEIAQMNRDAQKLFQRLVRLRREELLDDNDHADNQYHVFLAHAGEDKFLYVDGQLNYKLKASRAGVTAFIDVESIKSADLTNDNGVDRGLLSSRVVLLVMSQHFICKPWPLYEFFFASARMDNEFETNGFKIMVDSYHDPQKVTSSAWLSNLEQLALPWPALLSGQMPPVVPSTNARVVDHVERVIDELHNLLAVPSRSSTHASSSTSSTTSARLICVFVLAPVIDMDEFCANLAPMDVAISPTLSVSSFRMHALTNQGDGSAPVLVVLQMPRDDPNERATRQDLAALMAAVRQPPMQLLSAAFFDGSTDERVLVSNAKFVDNEFKPTTSPSAEHCSINDIIHECAQYVYSDVERIAIVYVPSLWRDTLLRTISQQWVQHATARRIWHKFAFVKLHNVNGNVRTDRAAFWSQFGALFCDVVHSRSTDHFLVLPAHVGALMACLVRGGAWDAYLEWLAGQTRVSVLGLPVRQVDAEAVRSLRMLRTDSIEWFSCAATFAAAVGDSVWSERSNWSGLATDDMHRLFAEATAVKFSLVQIDSFTPQSTGMTSAASTVASSSAVMPPRSELDGDERIALLVLDELQRRDSKTALHVNTLLQTQATAVATTNPAAASAAGFFASTVLTFLFGTALAPAVIAGGLFYALADLWLNNRQADAPAVDERRSSVMAILTRASSVIANAAPDLHSAMSDEDVISWLASADSDQILTLIDALKHEFQQ